MAVSRIPFVGRAELETSRHKPPKDVDIATLERELRKAITGEVRFDAGSKALYHTDGSNCRQVPIGVDSTLERRRRPNRGRLPQVRCARSLSRRRH